MGRRQVYSSNADRQRAYRERKTLARRAAMREPSPLEVLSRVDALHAAVEAASGQGDELAVALLAASPARTLWRVVEHFRQAGYQAATRRRDLAREVAARRRLGDELAQQRAAERRSR